MGLYIGRGSRRNRPDCAVNTDRYRNSAVLSIVKIVNFILGVEAEETVRLGCKRIAATKAAKTSEREEFKAEGRRQNACDYRISRIADGRVRDVWVLHRAMTCDDNPTILPSAQSSVFHLTFMKDFTNTHVSTST